MLNFRFFNQNFYHRFPWNFLCPIVFGFKSSNRLLAVWCFTVLFSMTWAAHDEYENMQIYPQKEHSLTRPYQGSGMMIPNWDIIGNAMVSASFIRLTPDQQSRYGGIWNKIPISFPYWEVHLEFKVSGHGKELFGDGMAFWYVKHPMQRGNIFGSADYFWGLAIFLDTYANQNGLHSHSHPYISAMVNNATVQYDHDRDGTHTSLAGCEAKFRNFNDDTFISIKYYNDTLTVMTDFEGDGNWAECFRSEGVFLPTGLYFGVTAATGDLSDNHDVISIKTYRLDVPVDKATYDRSLIIPAALESAQQRDHVDDPDPPMSRWKFYLIILIVMMVLAGLGYLYYQKTQETNRKRFY